MKFEISRLYLLNLSVTAQFLDMRWPIEHSLCLFRAASRLTGYFKLLVDGYE